MVRFQLLSRLRNRTIQTIPEFEKETNAFFEIFKMQFFLFRLFGIFPYNLVYKGNQIVLKIWSVETMVAILFYIVGAILSLDVFIYAISDMSTNGDQFDYVISLMPIFSLTIYFLAYPLLFWQKKKCLTVLINNWLLYQNKFKNVTRLPFVSVITLKRKSYWFCIGAVGINTLMRLSFLLSWRNISRQSIFFGIYVASSQTCILVYWWSAARFHESTVDILNQAIDMSMVQFNRLQFSRLTELWLQLRSLFNSFYAIHSSLFFSHLILIIVNCTSLFYHTVKFAVPAIINSNDFRHRVTLTLHFVLTVSWYVSFYLYIENGYKVDKRVNFDLEEKILLTNMVKLEPALLHELWNLLRVTKIKSSAIYMFGIESLKINREFLGKVFAVIVDYIIVLLQFSFILEANDGRNTRKSLYDH